MRHFRIALLGAALLAATSLCPPAFAQSAAPGTQAAPQFAPVPPQPMILDVGAGRLIQLPRAAQTILSADPNVVRVQPASPTSMFMVGAGAGKTTVIATAENGTPIAQFDVTVRGTSTTIAPPTGTPRAASGTPSAASTAEVERTLRQAVASASDLHVFHTGKGWGVSGTVTTPADAQRIYSMLRAYGGDGSEIENNLQVLSAIQVNVRVRIAEISRTISRDLGFNWQALGNSGRWLLGVHTGTAAASQIISALLPASGTPTPFRLGAGFRDARFDVNGVIDALAGDKLITILAEPNLTAQSGETASFLAGGEFPIPVAANSTNGASQISIEFKQFGVALSFVPTVLGPDRINLRVRPEVSQLSSEGAINLPVAGGVLTIPALSVRRAETTVELGSGQSFAIAGLLQRNSTQTGSALPGLGEIPVMGALFKSTAFQRDESELVIFVTPYIVRPVTEPARLAAPTDGFRPATDLDRLLYNRQIDRGAPMNANVPADSGFILE